MARILVLHGPNLDLLGEREPEHYGHTTLASLNARLVSMGAAAGHEVECLQSNAEHLLIERLHAARRDGTAWLVFNPAGFTHTSVALRDAVIASGVPFVEVHLSNVHAREPFRHHSYFSDVARAVVTGLGPYGYECALDAGLAHLARPRSS